MLIVARAMVVSLIAITALCEARAATPDVRVDGRLVRFRGQAPWDDRGVWMVPARPVLAAGNTWYSWDPDDRSLEVRTLDERFTVWADGMMVRSGARTDSLSRRMVVRDGEPCVPAEFLARCLLRSYVFDREANVLLYRSRMAPGDLPEPGARRGGGEAGRRGERDAPGLRVDEPAGRVVAGPAVRFAGASRGTRVRVRLTAIGGARVIDQSSTVTNGRWLLTTVLRPGSYRAIMDAFDGQAACGHLEMDLVVGR